MLFTFYANLFALKKRGLPSWVDCLPCFVMSVLLASPLPTFAEIYTCVDAHGRKSMSDQPCTNKGAEIAIAKIPTAAIAPARTLKTEAEPTMAQWSATLEQRIQTKHKLECRDMRIVLKSHGHFAHHLLDIQDALSEADKVVWGQYRTKCLPQAKDIVALEEAQRDGERQDKNRRASCEAKSREYETRKQRAQFLTESELASLAMLQTEVSRGCR